MTWRPKPRVVVHQPGDPPVRHPRDVLGDPGGRGRPVTHPASVAAAAAAYETAAEHRTRLMALWELVDLGPASVDWCEAGLRSADVDRVEDAAAVLAWIGTPERLVPTVTSLIDRFGDSQVADVLHMALPTAGMLLGGTHEPFTSTIWFVRAPYARVLRDRARWFSYAKKVTTTSEHRGALAELLDLLAPPQIPGRKVLYVDTESGWTAVFGQGDDLSYLAAFGRRLRTVVLRTNHAPHLVQAGRTVRHGDTAFWLIDGERRDLGPLRQLRTVQASRQDHRWVFDAHGEVQPYEDTARYERPLVRDRFDLDMLNAYCRALGVRRDDPDFYGPRATLVARAAR